MKFKLVETVAPSPEFPLLISANNCFDIGLSKYQFNQILNDPTAPVVKVGNKRYLKRDEFMKWLDRHISKNKYGYINFTSKM